MVKRCSWGTCTTDSRYPERSKGGVVFFPFPKPLSNLEKCRTWIRLCGRPKSQLNEDILRNPSKSKHFYVCSKHFKDGRPSEDNPHPEPVFKFDRVPKPRSSRHARQVNNQENKDRPTTSVTYVTVPCSSLLQKGSTVQMDQGTDTDKTDWGPGSVQMDQGTKTVQMDSDSRQIDPELSYGCSPLDMLALASENVALKKQVAELLIQNEQLIRDSQATTPATTHQCSSPVMTFNSLKETKTTDECVYYTGFNRLQFNGIFKFLVPDSNILPFKMKKKMKCAKILSIEDQLLLVFAKLRQNFDFVHLGKLFNLSSQDCSSLFSQWIDYMYFRFTAVPIFPHRNIIIEHMPRTFKEEFPNTLIIIDGTEIKIEKPSSLTQQSQCYSDYKSTTTLKGLVGIDPRGSIIFASMLFTGNISDNEITRRSGFYDLLENHLRTGKILPGDGIMADKGFRIHDDLNKIGLVLNIPPFASSGSQMKPADVTLTEKIARHRVHVERAIARVKQFKILSGKVKLGLFSIINQIWFNCCFLTNFMSYLIKEESTVADS